MKAETKLFWIELEACYPQALAVFNEWLEKYKTRVYWSELFNCGPSDVVGETSIPVTAFQDLPIEMQIGVYIQFTREFYQDPCPAFVEKTECERLHRTFALVEEVINRDKQL